MTGGTNTHASAVASPAVHRQPNSCTTSATSSLMRMRCPLRYADTSAGSSPSARATAPGSTRSQNGSRATTSEVVSTSPSGVPSSTASDGAAVGSGDELVDPEHPVASSSIATATVARATRGRRTGDMHGSLGPARIPDPWGSSSNLDPVIRFEKVSKTYPGQGHSALDNVSIDVEKGEFVFLVGASGSGKSTALRLVLRESRPTAGRVYVAGKEINRLASWKVPRLRRQIGTVFQDFRLLPNKTVSENVAFALQVIGKSRSEIGTVVPETLELVGLDGKGDRMPDELSGGEQQRVAIARAFVNRPMILIADEPTGNLDPATSVGIMKLLDRINRTGTTVVMATHDHGVVDQMRKRVVELSAGQVVRDQAQGGYGFSH